MDFAERLDRLVGGGTRAACPGGTMLNILRRPLAPEEAIDEIFPLLIDADAIWEDVCALGPYAAPPAIACCEVAFARIAVMKLIMMRTRSRDAAETMCGRVDILTEGAFGGGDEETEAFYGRALPEAAALAVALYLASASHPAPLTAAVVDRIGGDHGRVLRSTPIFTKFGSEVDAALSRLRLR